MSNSRLLNGPGVMVIAGVISAAVYYLGLMGIFFLIPLLIVIRKRSFNEFVLTALLSAVLITLGKLIILGLQKKGFALLDVLELSIPWALLAGWVLQKYLEKWNWRFLYRIGITFFVMMILLIPLFQSVVSLPVSEHLLKSELNGWMKLVSDSGALDTLKGLNVDLLYVLLKEVFLSCFVIGVFLVWLVTWKIDQGMKARESFLKTGELEKLRIPTLRNFRLPDFSSWIFLILWVIVLLMVMLGQLGFSKPLGLPWYLLANAALLFFVVHWLAGWGVVQSLLDRTKLPVFLQMLVKALLIILTLMPETPVQLVLLFAVPLLSVMELWVNFRNKRSEE